MPRTEEPHREDDDEDEGGAGDSPAGESPAKVARWTAGELDRLVFLVNSRHQLRLSWAQITSYFEPPRTVNAVQRRWQKMIKKRPHLVDEPTSIDIVTDDGQRVQMLSVHRLSLLTQYHKPESKRPNSFTPFDDTFMALKRREGLTDQDERRASTTWREVAAAMNNRKTPSQLRARRSNYLQMHHRCKAGKWTTQEMELLTSLCAIKPISWSLVARTMRTRTARQCKLKWLYMAGGNPPHPQQEK